MSRRHKGVSLSFSREKKMQLQIYLLLPLFFYGSAFAADLLQNPDFESPPSNSSQNSTAPFLLLNENNTIPGWSFEGAVQYVTAGKNISLPGNGHAIQLGQDGKINQTFNANIADFMDYLLTFTLAPDGQNCSSYASIDVSAPDSLVVFSLKQHYGKEAWESYGVYLGNWEQGESINLVIGSRTTDTLDNSTCWPLIDKLLLKTVGTLGPGKDNLLQNGGFEFGPEFLSNSTEGILLDAAPSPVLSALTQWSIIGTIKYIDSKHYFVPEGEAAIEIVSGISTGIQTAITLTEGSAYGLEFTLGDANDSCVGNFVVGVQAGSTVQNFTLQSNGTGRARQFSLLFKASSTTNSISFISYTASQTKDGLLCGPVVDNVILRAASHGMKLQMQWKVMISMLFLVAIL